MPVPRTSLVPVSDEVQQTDGRRLVRARNRERLLQASSQLFAQRGYRGTTTRDIAEAAGITERTLFRHVPSKAALFRDAVIAPVETFVNAFSEGWADRPQGARDTEVEVREFFASLLAVIEGERHLLLALMAALAYESEDPDFPELQHTLAPMLSTLDRIFAVEADLRGWTLDPVIGVRMIVGMALAVTVHADWLFAGQKTPRRDALVDELTQLTTWGLAGRPITSPGARRARPSTRQATR
jgi:AcrR family transcriptional regulator